MSYATWVCIKCGYRDTNAMIYDIFKECPSCKAKYKIDGEIETGHFFHPTRPKHVLVEDETKETGCQLQSLVTFSHNPESTSSVSIREISQEELQKIAEKNIEEIHKRIK